MVLLPSDYDYLPVCLVILDLLACARVLLIVLCYATLIAPLDCLALLDYCCPLALLLPYRSIILIKEKGEKRGPEPTTPSNPASYRSLLLGDLPVLRTGLVLNRGALSAGPIANGACITSTDCALPQEPAFTY